MFLPAAEPFFFRGGPVGCLLIHGFTSTPKEMRWLGEFLAGQGHTVLGVRLAHHATQPADLNRSRWQDWHASVLDGWHILRDQCRQVFPIGLSMGGAAALLLAAQQPVAGVAALSAPIRAPHPAAQYFDWLWPLIPYVRKGPRVWDDPGVAAWHVAYPVYPLRGVRELRGYLRAAAEALPRVTAPALLVNSRSDRTVPPAHHEIIFNGLGSADKEAFWVERSNHILVEDSEKEAVFEKVAEWFRTRAGLRRETQNVKREA